MTTVDNKKMYVFLLILTSLSAIGFQGWRTLINNFAVEVVHVDGQQMGVIQSIREIPGFLSLLVIYVLLVIKEHRLAALSVAVLGLGVALTGILPSFWGVVLSTLLMSFGFHYFETLNQSLSLQYFEIRVAPVVLGKLRAIASASNVAIGIVIFLLADTLSFAQMFGILGGLICIAGLWCIVQDPTDKNIVPQRKGMVLRSRYWLFYALTFMAGARRQIFVAFAVFLLVKKFGYSVQAITVLFVVNNIINYFLSPLIGRAIARFGERAILSLEYLSLIGIFLTYAYTESGFLAAAMYILDHIFFNFAIAIRTYFQKIADPSDIAPSMAVGFTINHIAAVVVPVVGGTLWMINYRIPFLLGVGMGIVSLILTQFMPVSAANCPPAEPVLN